MFFFKKISPILSKPTIVFSLVLSIQLVIFLSLILRPFTITPPDHVYSIIGKNFFYPNLIIQSKNGAWGIIDTHTTQPVPRLFIYLFFVFLGKIAAILAAEPAWVYLWSRVIAGIFAFWAVYWFIKTFLPKHLHALAILFTLAIETGPLLSALPEVKLLFDSRMLLERNFGLPHHLTAKALGILFIGALLLSVKKPSPKRAIAVLLTGLASTIAMPGYTFTFALSAFAPWGIWSMLTKTVKKVLPTLLLGGIAIVGPNLVFAVEFAKGLPWTNSTPNERTWFTTEFIRSEYVSQLLFLLPLMILLWVLTKKLWRSWNTELKLLVFLMTCWVIGPILIVPLAKTTWFPMPNHRLTDGYGYLPAGILAALGLYSAVSLLRKKQEKILVGIVLISLTLIPSLYLTTVFTGRLFAAQEIQSPYVYLTKDSWEAIQFMKTVPHYSGVMVREQFGEIIPGFANVRVYIGGVHNFPDWLPRQWSANRFFSGELTTADGQAFLKASDITYVYAGPDELAIRTTNNFYPDLLTAVFTNPTVTVYQVRTAL